MCLSDKYTDYLEELLKPLMPYWERIGEFGDHESSQGANISWFEMFARSTYGLIPYTKVNEDNDLVPLFNKTLLRVINDSRYSSFVDGDQKAVELIPLVSMLYIHQKITWDTYSKQEQQSILHYFSQINRIQISTDNWQFFRILVTRIVNALGGNEDERYIKDSWAVVDKCYCGDGWYRDGEKGPKDYYVAFGYHFYSLLYRYLFPDDERAEIIKERALAFADDYRLFFDCNGRMIVYGRSMIYRYASLSFWSILLCNDILNESQRLEAATIIDDSISWWQKQRIVNNEGLLSLGIAYRNERVCEEYNSSGSPYWLMKSFVFLLAPQEYLKIDESEYDIHTEIKTIANNDAIVVRNKWWNTLYINSYKGVSYVLHNASKYMRFAYNSATGFNVGNSNNPSNFSDDNSLLIDIAGICYQRESNQSYSFRGDYQVIGWKCGNIINVKSYVIPRVEGYIRVHIIKSKINTDCYESGFAQSVYCHEWKSLMSCLYGGGQSEIRQNEVNSNIYHSHTQMPVIKYRISKGINMVADYTYMEDADSAAKQYSVRIKGGSIRVSGEDLDVQLKLSLRERVAVVVNNMRSRGYQYSYSKILSIYQNTNWLKQMYRKAKSIIK